MARRRRKQCKTPERAGCSTAGEDEEFAHPETEGADYERQRQLRIVENRAKLAALGLPSMAAVLAPIRKDEAPEKENDEEYMPNSDDEDRDDGDFSSSSEAFEDADDDDDYVNKPLSSFKTKKSNGKMRMCKKKFLRKLDFVDEDDALKKAIAFSKENSRVACEAVKGSIGKGPTAQSTPQNKRRKSVNENRVQLNEDDVVIHFCQFDEVGKGSINLRDLERMASSHDFTWTEKELMDMIQCFDADGDRKLTMEDFRNIVVRCNMLQASKHP